MAVCNVKKAISHDDHTKSPIRKKQPKSSAQKQYKELKWTPAYVKTKEVFVPSYNAVVTYDKFVTYGISNLIMLSLIIYTARGCCPEREKDKKKECNNNSSSIVVRAGNVERERQKSLRCI